MMVLLQLWPSGDSLGCVVPSRWSKYLNSNPIWIVSFTRLEHNLKSELVVFLISFLGEVISNEVVSFDLKRYVSDGVIIVDQAERWGQGVMWIRVIW